MSVYEQMGYNFGVIISTLNTMGQKLDFLLEKQEKQELEFSNMKNEYKNILAKFEIIKKQYDLSDIKLDTISINTHKNNEDLKEATTEILNYMKDSIAVDVRQAISSADAACDAAVSGSCNCNN